MKSFQITEEQIARVIGGCVADEAARSFNRHFDFLTIAAWDGDTQFGDGGLGLSAEQVSVCQARAAAFFGLPADQFASHDARTFAEAAAIIAAGVSERLLAFSFKPASRDDAQQTSDHAADIVFQDAAAAANIISGRRRFLSFVAPHSLLGFCLTILTPNLQGIEAIDARGMTPDVLSSTLVYGDALIATPTLWRYMMRENLSSPDNTMAVSFGEAMAPDLAADMRKAGFGVLREIYGSTESGLMGWRDSPAEPFVLFDHWRHDGDNPIRIAPNGDEAPAVAMDFLKWDGPRAFRLAGRRDGAVQVGAVNVQPDAVARQVLQHPAVEDCAVRASIRDDGINRLVAHIVLRKEIVANEAIVRDIDAWCRTRLRQQERPRIYQFHNAL